MHEIKMEYINTDKQKQREKHITTKKDRQTTRKIHTDINTYIHT